jgi:uncharacterized damage-inducible protein DinB
MTEAEKFLQSWQNEVPATLRVLKAFPPDQANYRPYEKSQSAKDLAVHLASVPEAMLQILDGTFKFPPNPPSPPERWEDVIRTLETLNANLVRRLQETTDADFHARTLKLPVNKKEWREIPALDFFWFILADHIHHRGQFSVYLRMAGGKVPSIYGTSADDQEFQMDFSKFKRG